MIHPSRILHRSSIHRWHVMLLCMRLGEWYCFIYTKASTLDITGCPELHVPLESRHRQRAGPVQRLDGERRCRQLSIATGPPPQPQHLTTALRDRYYGIVGLNYSTVGGPLHSLRYIGAPRHRPRGIALSEPSASLAHIERYLQRFQQIQQFVSELCGLF